MFIKFVINRSIRDITFYFRIKLGTKKKKNAVPTYPARQPATGTSTATTTTANGTTKIAIRKPRERQVCPLCNLLMNRTATDAYCRGRSTIGTTWELGLDDWRRSWVWESGSFETGPLGVGVDQWLFGTRGLLGMERWRDGEKKIGFRRQEWEITLIYLGRQSDK
jgi:hypothetical protein